MCEFYKQGGPFGSFLKFQIRHRWDMNVAWFVHPFCIQSTVQWKCVGELLICPRLLMVITLTRLRRLLTVASATKRIVWRLTALTNNPSPSAAATAAASGSWTSDVSSGQGNWTCDSIDGREYRGVHGNGNSHSHGIPMGMGVVLGY